MGDYAISGVVEIRVSAEVSRAREIGEIIARALEGSGYELISLSGERYCVKADTRRNCFVTMLKAPKQEVDTLGEDKETDDERNDL